MKCCSLLNYTWICVHGEPVCCYDNPLLYTFLGACWYHTKHHSCSFCALSVLLGCVLACCVCGSLCCAVRWLWVSSLSLCSERVRARSDLAFCHTGNTHFFFTECMSVCMYVVGFDFRCSVAFLLNKAAIYACDLLAVGANGWQTVSVSSDITLLEKCWGSQTRQDFIIARLGLWMWQGCFFMYACLKVCF